MGTRCISRGLPILSGEICRLLRFTMSLRSRPWPTLMSLRFYVRDQWKWPHGFSKSLTGSDAAFGFTFVSATAMILAGAMLERGRLLPSMVFLLCWTTFVYYM